VPENVLQRRADAIAIGRQIHFDARGRGEHDTIGR
jgi:hypothetical protein